MLVSKRHQSLHFRVGLKMTPNLVYDVKRQTTVNLTTENDGKSNS